MDEKREQVLQATLDLINERGLQSTPMSAIAKRSGVAVGTIYHHFDNKEILVTALYQKLSGKLGEYALHNYDAAAPVRVRFSNIWTNALRFTLRHPKEVLFLDQYAYSPYIDPVAKEDISGWFLTLGQIFAEGQAQQIIKPLHPEILIHMTLGMLMYLAKGQIGGKLELDEETQQAAVDACWDTIRS